MMDAERWKKLRDTFDDGSKFEMIDGEEWYNTGIPGDLGIAGDLYGWLECTSCEPSYKMIKEFYDHGYIVLAGEIDSFGWLTGIVHDEATGRKICFG